MERVLPTPEVQKILRDLAVGLAADCDRPEADVEKLFREKLANARTLPFVAFITPDGEWVEGFSGFKQGKEFLDVVEAANKSPFLLATPAVQKKLAGLLTKAQKALEKEDWRAIVKAGQQAAKTTGRCTERDQLEAIVGKARAWAATQFDAAIDMGQSGGDLGEARVLIQSVKSRFTKEPEAEEAETGLKALRALDRIRKAEADGKDASAMRADASKEFAGARWAKMFVTKAETPAPSAEGS